MHLSAVLQLYCHGLMAEFHQKSESTNIKTNTVQHIYCVHGNHIIHIISSGFAMAPHIRSSEAPYKVKYSQNSGGNKVSDVAVSDAQRLRNGY